MHDENEEPFPMTTRQREWLYALSILQECAIRGQDFLERPVTSVETWVHDSTPESKHASVEWKHPGSPPKGKFKIEPSVGKVMATVFSESEKRVVG